MIQTQSLYLHMQAAIDIVGQSPHPVNKIAATLVQTDGLSVSRTNTWPDEIAKGIGTQTRIGNASGTIHAETACILAAQKTQDSAIFITDPPCPNCMKNMAEAGINALYIDHKGFKKDFALRRGGHFENMSMCIAERAGISVHIVHRKEQRIDTILRIPENYIPADEFPPRLYPAEGKPWKDLISTEHQHYGEAPFALAIVQDHEKNTYAFSARNHTTIGYSADEDIESPDGKYSFILEPVNRLMMAAARKGLSIRSDSLYSSRVPTSRELINMIGANLDTLRIGDMNAARDIFGPQALKQLTCAKIITLISKGE
ncbi:MAG: deoxycytidylate deaminase [Alphaproteobacteria bacterium]|nr:deoxycytidylate deaminase [Alphaproteobacteria bacterium]